MTTPSESQSSKDVSRSRSQEEIRNPGLGHARTRERLVKRVLAARKRLPQTPERRRAA